MRKIIAGILLVSQMLIVIGNILPAMFNAFEQYHAKCLLKEKIDLLPSRTNFLSVLNEINQHRQEEKRRDSSPVILVPSNISPANIEMVTSFVKYFSSIKILLSEFESLDASDVFLGLVSPPPKQRF